MKSHPESIGSVTTFTREWVLRGQVCPRTGQHSSWINTQGGLCLCTILHPQGVEQQRAARAMAASGGLFSKLRMINQAPSHGHEFTLSRALRDLTGALTAAGLSATLPQAGTWSLRVDPIEKSFTIAIPIDHASTPVDGSAMMPVAYGQLPLALSSQHALAISVLTHTATLCSQATDFLNERSADLTATLSEIAHVGRRISIAAQARRPTVITSSDSLPLAL